MTTRNKLAPPPEAEADDGEINTVYGDMITFVAMLFILLFTLSYNEQKDETFFTQMRLTFGAKKIEQTKLITSEELFVSKLQGYIEKEKLEEQARVLVDEHKIKLILNPPALYNSGSAVIKPAGKKLLSEIGQIFSSVRNPIIIEGHSDNIPFKDNRGKYESNWDLSFHRAYSVVKYWVKRFDFSPVQLSCLGYGEFHPLVPNDSPENRSRNRRIEINIIRVTEAAALVP